MRKLGAGIRKELILLLRDKAGLALMFVMPVVLVVVITLVQNSTFQLVQDKMIPLLVVNNDEGDVSRELIQKIKKIDEFNAVFKSNVSPQKINNYLQKGMYKVGVLIPKGYSQFIHAKSEKNATKIVASMNNTPTEAVRLDTATIQILFDPIMKLSYRSAIANGLESSVSAIETKLLVQNLYKNISDKELPKDVEKMLTNPQKQLEEVLVTKGKEGLIPSSTLHNVPAWTLFAMFFIVITLSGNIIYEKNQGSFTRLRTLPVSMAEVFLSKISVFMGVCFLQVGLIMVVAFFFFPYLGLPPMEMPSSVPLFFVITFLIALAATSYGMLLGALFDTQAQAGPFGALSVIILAALGGIWVPTFAMPTFLQKIAAFSPLNWGLEAYYGIFIRNASFSDILFYALFYILFSIFCFSFTFTALKNRHIL